MLLEISFRVERTFIVRVGCGLWMISTQPALYRQDWGFLRFLLVSM